MSETLQRTLELTRLELLDMGLRGNTLLNLRHTAATVPVVRESSAEVFRLLVLEQRALRLIPEGEQPKDKRTSSPSSATVDRSGEGPGERTKDWIAQTTESNEPALADLASDHGQQTTIGQDAVAVHLSDLFLQTQLGEQALDQRLVKISNAARGYYEEQGVEILFLALGCLHWSEDTSGRSIRRAPLVLIPVELQRTAAGHGFKLVYTGADLGANLTLASKLKSEFHIDLPPFEEDGFALMPYLTNIARAVSARENWRVDVDEICLGFFSFGKFQMYQDLDPDSFPEGSKPWEHTLVRALLADGFDAPEFDTQSSEGAPGLTGLNFVKDSDTSQTEAALSVARGSSLVIQGPPGTGKSQTITNIIAELLARGKTVLFVAEKMAALEVVKRRLDECHLGEAVLELHSHKSRRKAVIEELARTLEAGVPQTPDRSSARARHQHLQGVLDTYWEAVRAPVLQSGLDYVEVLGAHLKLSDEVDVAPLGGYVDFSGMRHWTEEEFEQAGHQVAALVAHLREHGSPAESPWCGTTLRQFSPGLQRTVLDRLAVLRSVLDDCQAQAGQLESVIKTAVSDDLHRILKFVACFGWMSQAPTRSDLLGVTLDLDLWHDIESFQKLIATGKAMQEPRVRQHSVLLDQAWNQDVLALRGVWATTGDRWWRFMSGEFRQARSSLRGLLKGELPDNTQACVQILDDILAYQSLRNEFERQRQALESSWESAGFALSASLGSQWQGVETNWDRLQDTVSWLHKAAIHVRLEEVPRALVQRVADLDDTGRAALWQTLEQFAQAIRALEQAIDGVLESVRLQRAEWRVCDDKALHLSRLQSWLPSAQGKVQDLYALSRFNLIQESMENPALQEIARRARSWGERSASGLLKVLEASWYDGLVREAYATRPVIAQFDRAAHEHAVAEFASLDKQLFVHAQERLVCQLHERLPSPMAVGEMAILRREMNKKRRHMALRQLIKVAGRAVQQIKPVFMMSPMSIATYLEHGAVDFDVVIFDEASQVRVADALGALMRGRQAVVVGDSRQMPPTDFFSRTLELDDEQAEQSQTADIESILGMFVAQGAPQKMLRWHYRSRHDSLIAVSNESFYEGKLLIFPTPGIHPRATGLRMRYLPDTHYDRGGTRTNLGEAQALAQAVMEHARQTPGLSLGVVAFSTAQRDCLLLEIEHLRRMSPELEPFFNASRPDGENFFVKNLENVQGDERDVILISIGYGRTDDGRLVPSFGPVNNEGGERRLNVLITRAKLAMEVFCNFTASELQINAGTPFGVRVLERFLRYAQTSELPDRSHANDSEVGAFEQYLCEEIRDLGFDPQPRLGQSGFYIDIAVQDPQTNQQDESVQRYALALQTDGASYQRSADTRERERVRAGVLSAFGWQLYPVWSTDWFRSPAVERDRLRQAIESAVMHLHRATSLANEPAPSPSSSNGIDTIDAEPPVTEAAQSAEHQALTEGGYEGSDSQPPVLADPSQMNREEGAQGTDNLPETVSIERLDPAKNLTQSVAPYQPFEGDLGLPRHQALHEALPESLSKSIRKLVAFEGSVHVDLIARRLADDAGVSRLTSRTTEQIREGIAYGVSHGELFEQGPFVHAEPAPDVPLRSRAALPARYRNIDYVSPFDLQTALRQVIGHSFGITADEAISASLSLIGFQRVSAKSRAITREVLDEMVKGGVIRSSRGKLTLGG
ncbi:DUF3320 domain-containing protein [Orrella marina]|nr:DUF3320 domain-containing protein [Orrella marina]